MKLVLFGAPGAGKGTLAGKIKEILPNIEHISTGDLFRENVKKETPIGKKAKEFIDAGKLVPDEIVIGMVEQRLNQEEVKKGGFMLDGFPRTLNQAEKLAKITNVNLVLVIDVPRNIIHQRILGRISCPNCNEIYNKFTLPPKKQGICDKCGEELVYRSDDNKETLNKRIDAYEANAGPIIESYSKKRLVKKVDGTQTMEMTKDDLKNLLNIT